ncbi:BrnA antitoxin family protein [uncultured Roseovarius sp.]|uniref:BrnA antitoxin family protein n=1 Tax=uncultured Roseovarius sp. TaxID=293344 RepID=UPI0026325C4B|nr:BrnA antitoxin family protein [uncultured Roseovarius sp.]
MTRMTKTARIAREGLLNNLIHLHRDGWIDTTLAEEIPEAWHTLEADLDVVEPKEKVTLYLDRSVARFYRGMGRGYHARINRLLATWAQMKIAGEVKLDEYLAKRVGMPEEDAPEAKGAQMDPEYAALRKKRGKG